MTMREIEVACRGYETRLARTLVMERFMSTILINANLKKGRPQVRPEDIMPLVIDKRRAKVVDLITLDELESLEEKLNRAQWQ